MEPRTRRGSFVSGGCRRAARSWLARGVLLGLLSFQTASSGFAINDVGPDPDEVFFRRGDTDESGFVTISDAVGLLGALFVDGASPIRCADAFDANDDGRVDLADAVRILGLLFLGEPDLPSPYPECGFDFTEDPLDCKSFDGCEPPLELVNSIGMRLVYIPPGTFVMGSPLDERGRDADEVQHQVTLTCGFYMGATEVTRRQFMRVMGFDPSPPWPGLELSPDLPVRQANWYDAMAFCRRLSQAEGRTVRYRLPTEAEWEYACRAGTTTRFWFGDLLECPDDRWWRIPSVDPLPLCAEADEYMWWGGSANQPPPPGASPVATKKANPWGLYDMHGNTAEWCLDFYAPYPDHPVVNPRGPNSGGLKVVRGNGVVMLRMGRSAYRHKRPPENRLADNSGFRVVLELCPLLRASRR